MSAPPAVTGKLRPPPAGYAGLWAALATVYVALYATGGIPVFMAVRGALAAVLPNALLALISLSLAGRWPWRVEGKWRQVLRLAPALLALSLAATAGWLLLIALDGWIAIGVVKLPPAAIVVWQMTINTILHVAACGIGYAWHALDELRRAQDRAVRADALRARAELQLLRSQLQPHFVLNVLHALLGLVRRDPDRAEGALERLGDLLRFGQWVHQSGADFVALSREWEFVKSYLDLERIRLGDRLDATMDADGGSLDAPLPPFALQPLVENAVVHAVAPRAEGGRVTVVARRSGGRLTVTVTDDGPGARAAEIAASPRLGLRLLQERLSALYGHGARLTFASPDEGGLRVCLDLPEDPGGESA